MINKFSIVVHKLIQTQNGEEIGNKEDNTDFKLQLIIVGTCILSCVQVIKGFVGQMERR